MEAFDSYLMSGILTWLVNLLWVGLLAARAGRQNMTSSPLVCAPYEFLCVYGHLNYRWAEQWSGCGVKDRVPWPQEGTEMQISFDPGQAAESVYIEHWSLTELLLCFSNSWTQLVDLCPPQHLWGRELFDRVKGSPSIRPCVLILALGRFPIDYLTTQKHCTSLDRPTHTRPNQSWPSVYLAC